MSSSPTQQPTREGRAPRPERSRRAPKALLWLMIAAIAAFPFPWWW